jgi:hypothetical protein
MNARHCIWSVAAAALWMSVPTQGVAQPNDERVHTPRPDDVRPPYDREAIQRRLKLGRDLNDADKLLEQILKLSPKDLEDLARIINKDPELRHQLTKRLAENTELREDLTKSIGANPDKARKWLDDTRKDLKLDPSQPNAGTQTQKGDPQPPNTSSNGKRPDSAPAPPSSEGKAAEPSAFKKFLSKAGPNAADLLANLGLKDDAEFLKGLFRGKIPGGNDGYLAKAVARATKVARELPLDKIASGDFSGVFENWHMPSLPRLNFSFGGRDTSTSGSPGSASGGVGASTGTQFVWVVLVLVLVAFLWKGKELLGPKGAATDGAWKLGPWPVRPENVRTRADLVRAFEYLAFLVLGPAARPRNHLDLADALGSTGTEPIRRKVATRLARLYEHARYAPQEEALPDADLKAARCDLTYLAGVAPA